MGFFLQYSTLFFSFFFFFLLFNLVACVIIYVFIQHHDIVLIENAKIITAINSIGITFPILLSHLQFKLY
jgi:cell division protein FtsL